MEKIFPVNLPNIKGHLIHLEIKEVLHFFLLIISILGSHSDILHMMDIGGLLSLLIIILDLLQNIFLDTKVKHRLY